jgi:AcrR family transcriptional regulator
VTTVTSSTGLRERKKAQTRQAIEAAALGLFEREGFDHTTIEHIAAACDVSPRTFFRYFGSKDDVLHGDNHNRLAYLVSRLRAAPADEPPFQALRRAVLDASTLYVHDREAILVRFRVLDRNPSQAVRGLAIQQLWEQAIVAALHDRAEWAGHPASPFQLRLIAGCALAALRAAVGTWQADGGTRDLSLIVQEAFDRLAAGLDPQPATQPATQPTQHRTQDQTRNH